MKNHGTKVFENQLAHAENMIARWTRRRDALKAALEAMKRVMEAEQEKPEN